jgi:ABC-type Fe3+ transport system permease subunit
MECSSASPAPILLALLSTNFETALFKKVSQTISYLPHFVSSVIIVGMYTSFSAGNRAFQQHYRAWAQSASFFDRPKYFRSLYTAMASGPASGGGTIIYLAALTGVDPELYEACVIDGGGRLRQTIHITLPGILKRHHHADLQGRQSAVGRLRLHLLMYTPSPTKQPTASPPTFTGAALWKRTTAFSRGWACQFGRAFNCLRLRTRAKRYGETSLW